MSGGGDRASWLAAYAKGLKGGNLFKALTAWATPRGERYQDPKPLVRVNHTEGPMLFLAQQIVKRMDKMGYPSRIQELYRTPERQATLKSKGRSKALGYQSPHQFFEAADIVHKTLYWDASPAYWDALAVVVRVIEAEYNVKLEHGHHWRFVDSAHVELKDWRTVRQRQLQKYGHNYKPTKEELLARWEEVLPSIPNRSPI